VARKKKGGKWIKGAIQRKGALTKKAKAAGAVTKKGTIEKGWLEKQASKGGTTTARQARLAKTLAKMPKRGRKKK